jgi:hypothetical protein
MILKFRYLFRIGRVHDENKQPYITLNDNFLKTT